jgi:Ca2+-binding EF-hand superfamily protein
MKCAGKKPREFWRIFKSKGQSQNEAVSAEDFYEHFKNLATQQNITDDEVEDFLKLYDENQHGDNVSSCDIDRSIKKEEIRKAC